MLWAFKCNRRNSFIKNTNDSLSKHTRKHTHTNLCVQVVCRLVGEQGKDFTLVPSTFLHLVHTLKSLCEKHCKENSPPEKPFLCTNTSILYVSGWVFVVEII